MKNILFLLFLACNTLSISNAQTLNCAQSTDNAEFVKGTWIGEFKQYSCGVYASYPMVIEIDEVNGKKFSGYFIWSDLPYGPNSKTVLTGELRGDSIFLHEDTLISGGNLLLNGIYETKIVDCNTLEGNWRLKKQSKNCDDPKVLKDGGSFSISKLVPHVEEEDKPAAEKREIVIKESLFSSSDYITVKLWDNGQEDGDIVTIRLNGKIALKKFKLTKKPYKIIIPLSENENIIELYAENVGRIPPNTAAFSIISGGKEIKSLVLRSNLNTSEAIQITKK